MALNKRGAAKTNSMENPRALIKESHGHNSTLKEFYVQGPSIRVQNSLNTQRIIFNDQQKTHLFDKVRYGNHIRSEPPQTWKNE